jgi:hypothetical protein
MKKHLLLVLVAFVVVAFTTPFGVSADEADDIANYINYLDISLSYRDDNPVSYNDIFLQAVTEGVNSNYSGIDISADGDCRWETTDPVTNPPARDIIPIPGSAGDPNGTPAYIVRSISFNGVSHDIRMSVAAPTYEEVSIASANNALDYINDLVPQLELSQLTGYESTFSVQISLLQAIAGAGYTISPVSDFSVTQVQNGTVANPDGVDGEVSREYKITYNGFDSTETFTITATIEATTAYVDTMLEYISYAEIVTTVPMTTLNTMEEAILYVDEIVNDIKDVNGWEDVPIGLTVTANALTPGSPAVAGTALNPDGSDGKLNTLVAISYSGETTENLRISIDITALTYDEVCSASYLADIQEIWDNIDLSTPVAGTFDASDCYDYATYQFTHPLGIAFPDYMTDGWQIAWDNTHTAATDGTASDPDGTNGSYEISAGISFDGVNNHQLVGTHTLVLVPETAYIEAFLEAFNDRSDDYTDIPMSAVNSQAECKTYFEELCADILSDNGWTSLPFVITVSIPSFSGASAGTATSSPTDGTFGYSILIEHEGELSSFIGANVTIKGTPYVAPPPPPPPPETEATTTTTAEETTTTPEETTTTTAEETTTAETTTTTAETTTTPAETTTAATTPAPSYPPYSYYTPYPIFPLFPTITQTAPNPIPATATGSIKAVVNPKGTLNSNAAVRMVKSAARRYKVIIIEGGNDLTAISAKAAQKIAAAAEELGVTVRLKKSVYDENGKLMFRITITLKSTTPDTYLTPEHYEDNRVVK